MDETQPSKYRPLSDSFRGLTDRFPSFPTSNGGRYAEDKETLVLNDLVAVHHHHQHSQPQQQLQQPQPQLAFAPIDRVEQPPGREFYCGHRAQLHEAGMEHEVGDEFPTSYHLMQQNLDNQSRDWAYAGPTNATACYYNPLTSAVSIRYEQPPAGSGRNQGRRSYTSVKERMEARKKAERMANCCRGLMWFVMMLALLAAAFSLYVFVLHPKVFTGTADGTGLGKPLHPTWNSLVAWLEEHNLNFFGASSKSTVDANAENMAKALGKEDAASARPEQLVPSPSTAQCAAANCTSLPSRHLLEHYYQSGCRAFSQRGCIHCPDYFQCPNVSGARVAGTTKSVPGRCRFHERYYSPGDVFYNRGLDKSCQFCGCRNSSEAGARNAGGSSFPWNRLGASGVGVTRQTIHREALNSSLEVVCVDLLCPYIRPNRTDCHMVDTGDECCPRRQVCPELDFDEHDSRRTLRCHWKGREYRYDELIRPAPEVDPCLRCRCNEAWNDRDPARSGSCSLQKCPDFSNSKYHGCTPIYANATCCPVDFICSDPANPSPNSKSASPTIANTNRTSMSTCRLGDLYREVVTSGGGQIRVAKLFKGRRTLCSRCECRVPPLFTCLQEKLKDCDKMESQAAAAVDKDDTHGQQQQQRGHSAGLTRQLKPSTMTTTTTMTPVPVVVSTLAPLNNITGELDEVIFLNRRRRN